MEKYNKIVFPGGAGFVGQNLVAFLKEAEYSNIVVIDKHKKNLDRDLSIILCLITKSPAEYLQNSTY
jgi:nucleoside-diphosphate-sugar epimerase